MREVPIEEFITTTELACYQLNDSTKAAALRSDVTRILSKKRKYTQNTTPEERKALQSLSSRKDLKILPADKGRVTVLMNSNDYYSKLNALLEDKNTYTKLKSDPTNKFKNRLAKLLKGWKDSGKISHQTWLQLYPSAAEPPKFYGLPKIHKVGNPLTIHCLLNKFSKL